MSDIDLKALRKTCDACVASDRLMPVANAWQVLAVFDRLESAERRAEEAEKRLASASEMATKHGEVLQRVGSALDMPAGSSLHTELMPVVHALRKDAERYRFVKALMEKAADGVDVDKEVAAAMAKDAGAETPDRNAGNGVDAGADGGAEPLDPNYYGQEVLRTFYTAWPGDRESPVADDVLVDIIFRDGSTAESITAGTYWWMARSYHDDIIAWRPAMAQEGGK